MKGSSLPPGWRYAPFEDLVENLDGRRIPVRATDRASRQGKYPYYGASGVIDQVDDFLFDGSYLLVAEDGANLLSRSTAIAFQAHGRFWVNNHAHITKPLYDAPLAYLESFLNSIDLAPYVTGTAQPKLTQKALNKIEVPVAPLNEQCRIVAKLEALQSRSRRVREALDAVPALLEKLRQSILAAAFRGDLTKDWRAQNPNPEPATVLLARIRAERRKKWEEAELAKLKAKGKAPTDDRWKAKYKEPEPVDATGLPELPEGWCWASLDDLTLLVGGLTKGQKRAPDVPLRDVPYLRVANVQRGHLNLDEIKTIPATDDEITELRLLPGDILLNEGGDRDKLGRGWIWEGQIGTCLHQNHVFRARPACADLQPKYISHYANQRGQDFFVDQGKQTTNLASVSLSRVRRLPVALPPAEEQLEVVNHIEQRFFAAAAIRDAVVTAEAQATFLERSLLAKAFRGELVPQDPNDEPADAMLARQSAKTNGHAEQDASTKQPKQRSGAKTRGARAEEA